MLFTEAMELLEDSSWHGDHEFSGEQMDAWREQRGALLVGLAFVASEAEVPDEVWARIGRTKCPRTVVEEFITEESEVTHYTTCSECGDRIEHEAMEEQEIANADYSNGTEEGASWVDAARSVIDRAMREQRAANEARESAARFS